MPAARQRNLVHRIVRRVPGVQAAVRELRTRRNARQDLVTLDYAGAVIRMRPSSRRIASMRLAPVAKEPWTVDWIERSVREGDVLYDIGANVGDYALIAAKVGRKRAKVVAFEPGAATFASLCENIVLNDETDTVIPVPLVLGEASRMGTLGYSELQAGGAGHTLDAASSVYAQPVLVAALDDLIERFGLPAPTLVKLDVDGAEAAVLAGAARSLARTELRSLIVEVETANTDAVLQALASFDLVERFDTRDGVPLPDVWYGVFERR
ncbi:MAG TPA: FkbM family methyltransferase [Gaiellaceae bacterium]|nr:FkbM family methyltransferase [Gaiellaceae bacterium]